MSTVKKVYGRHEKGIWTPLRRRRSLTLTPRIGNNEEKLWEMYMGDDCKERA